MNLWFWKHGKRSKQDTPVVISHEDYQKLSFHHRGHFEKAASTQKVTYEHTVQDDGDFGLSLVAGMASDSAAIGFIAGGHLVGAMLGEMLTDSQQQADFGGGSGGGAGASGSFDNNVPEGPAPVQDSSFSDPGSSFSDPSPSMDSSSGGSDSSVGFGD